MDVITSTTLVCKMMPKLLRKYWRKGSQKLVSELSVGIQQIVEIARAMAEMERGMDEPPLTNNEIDRMMDIIAELKAKELLSYISLTV